MTVTRAKRPHFPIQAVLNQHVWQSQFHSRLVPNSATLFSMNPFRALLVAMLLIALPMQGIAAYVPMVACADGHAASNDGHQHTAAADPAHDSTAHDHHQGNSEPADPAGGHSCCHHVVSAAAPALLISTLAAPSILVAHVPLLNTLFIPELPQRPPRA